jgi:hypothetical protein
LKKTETTTALGYLTPPKKLSQKNVRTLPLNKPEMWSRLADETDHGKYEQSRFVLVLT